jgi:hypothetical protein
MKHYGKGCALMGKDGKAKLDTNLYTNRIPSGPFLATVARREQNLGLSNHTIRISCQDIDQPLGLHVSEYALSRAATGHGSSDYSL